MEPSLFLSMLGFLWVAAITHGPNNLLLTTSGANFGFMRSLWLMVGIMLGMQSICCWWPSASAALIWSTRRCT